MKLSKLFFSFLIIVFIFINCSNQRNDNKRKLGLLLTDSFDDTVALFSYPGRYTQEDKKREVINSILSMIENAQFSIKIYAYSLNNKEIIEALKRARNRGVIIEITGDKDQNYTLLKDNGFTIRVWKQPGLHHIKVILVDNRIFFTGTGNFSRYGLTLDWNGYIQFTIEEENRIKMLDFLEERYKSPVFSTNKIQFISSPENGFLSQNLLLKKIEEANFTIDYLIFDHFDPIISHALKQASSRGVKISGVYNAPVDNEGKYLADQFYGFTSRIFKDGNEDFLETGSFPDGGLLHHKSMVIDGKVLLSGSYNYSANARDSNREILFLSENYYLVSEFQEEFNRIVERSYPLPLKKFHLFPEKRNLTEGLTGDTICLPQSINSPIIELGNGVWKTYLYYPNTKNTNCINISSYTKISSGLTNADRSDFLSFSPLWDNFKVYDRNTNIIYLYQGEEINSLFHSNKKGIFLKPKSFSFTNSQIYFDLGANLELSGKNFHYWISGREIRKGLIQTIGSSPEFGHQTNIPTNSTERSYGLAFVELENHFYFFCFRDKTSSNRTITDYLVKQSFIENGYSGSVEQSCISN